MSRKYRFCDVCRGDLDLIECTKCFKKFHIECLDRADYPAEKIHTINSNTWICKDCDDGVQTISLCQDRMKKVKAFHQDILRSRAAFFKETRSYLQPFCSADNSLDRLINKYGGGGNNKGSVSSSSSKKSSKSKTSSKTSSSSSNTNDEATAAISSPRGLCSEVINELNRFESPSYIKGELREYQFEGVSGMFSWFSRGIGGILADEMGLGKTLQTITLLASMKHKLGVEGPHLVITPLAVLQNWANELNRFAPSLTFKKIYGSISERCSVLSDETVISGSYDVYLTTYETVMCEESFFCDSWTWATVTIDEGHRIKNETAKLRKTLNRIRCPLRILLTGTPVQNDLHELWALLNYILPEVFATSTVFDEGAKIRDDSVNQSTCKRARDVLDQFMIRRVKKDVEKSLLPKKHCVLYVHMTELQKRWYRSVIEQSRCLEASSHAMMTSQQFMHAFSQLNKIVNHPKQILNKREFERRQEINRMEKAAYSGSEFIKPRIDLLAPDPHSPLGRAEAELRACQGEILIQTSAKLATLDRLLIRLKNQGSRVLVFSQWTETLDILQEYVTYRFGGLGKVFLRLDGQTNSIVREIDVRKFNRDMSVFIYLISTKAGGMGINLATADSVVLFDSCWNPQVDLQAQDRAHRIGQKKQVTIYRLVTADSFEEKLKDMADRKLILNHMVVTSSGSSGSSSSTINIDDSSSSGIGGSYEDKLVTGLSEHMTLSQMSELLGFGMDKIIQQRTTSGGGNKNDGEMTVAQIDEAIDAAITGKTNNSSINDVVTTTCSTSDTTTITISTSAPVSTTTTTTDTATDAATIDIATTNATTTAVSRQSNVKKLSSSSSSSSYKNPILLDDDDDDDDKGNKMKEIDNCNDHKDIKSSGTNKSNSNNNNDDDDEAAEAEVEAERHLFSKAVSISNSSSTDALSNSASSSSSSSSNNSSSSSSSSSANTEIQSIIPPPIPSVLVESILDVFPPAESNPVPFPSSSSQLPSSLLSSSSSQLPSSLLSSSSSSQLPSSSSAAAVNEPQYHDSGRSRRTVKQTKRYQPAEFLPSNMNSKKVKRTRESVCFECDDGGTLIECNCCPKAYHLQCLGLTEAPKKSWTCPWHSCMECDRSSSNSGGMQFRCMTCPMAYCFDCWPKDQEMQNIEPTVTLRHSFLKHGFEIPKSSIFFECSDCVITREKKELAMTLQRKAAEEIRIKQQKQMEEYLKRQNEIRLKQQLVAKQQKEFAQRLQYAEIMNRQHQQLNGINNCSNAMINSGGINSGGGGSGGYMNMNNGIATGAPFQFRPTLAYNQPSSHLHTQQVPLQQQQHQASQSSAASSTNTPLLFPNPTTQLTIPSSSSLTVQQAQQLQQQLLRNTSSSSSSRIPVTAYSSSINNSTSTSSNSTSGNGSLMIAQPLPRFDQYVEAQKQIQQQQIQHIQQQQTQQTQNKTNSFFPLEHIPAYLQQQHLSSSSSSSPRTMNSTNIGTSKTSSSSSSLLINTANKVQKFENYLETTATSALPNNNSTNK